jgi:DnaK suppressor protein
VRDARELGSHNHHHTADVREAFDAEPEDDLVFALIQMKAETLERVNEAVRHFDEGTYGCCIACGEAIASSRLRAMPFAVRCRDCEETREEERRQRGSQRVQVGSGSRC